MSKEILQSKIKKWISSVRLIQQQTNRRFQDKEIAAFVGCIKSVLSGRGNATLISDDDLDTLEKYIKNSPADDFKAALENFYVLLKKNNTLTGLKEFYEVVDDQNFAETLQKICDSYEYEQQQKASAAGNADAYTYEGPFRITDGWVVVKDGDGNMTTRPSEIFNNSQYIYFGLKYDAPKSMHDVEIKTRIISPDGTQMGSSSYTLQDIYSLEYEDRIIDTNGWGNDYCTCYGQTGVWTAIFYVNDIEAYRLTFNVKAAPAPTEPTIRIDSLRFDNCDKNLNIITEGRLPSNTKYISPVIKYTRLRNYGNISLYYRIIKPDGQVERSADSPIGATNTYSFVPDESGERRIGGWGSELGNTYSAGTYRFELLQGNRVIYTTSFYLGNTYSEPKPTPKPTVTSSSSTSSSSQSGKKDGGSGCGCFAAVIVALMFIGVYWFWGDIRNWIFGDDEPKHDYVQVLPGIWNGTMGETDVTLEIDSIQNDSVVNAVISGQFSKVRTHKLKGYIGTNDSIYLDGASSGKYFNGKFCIGMSDDGRETMHGLFFDESSGDTIHLDAHKDEIPMVRPAKSNKSTNKKSNKSKEETKKETTVVEAERPELIPETKQDQERRKAADEDANYIYKTADVVAEFPGGQTALMKWLSQNVRYPEASQQNDIQGRVVVGFVIEKDGSISGARILKSADRDLDQEAIRVVQKMPRWNPGKINGEPVRMHYSIPLTFKLQK